MAVWVAEFVVDPDRSAGKFAGATGGWTMVAVSEPFDPFAATPEPVAHSRVGEGTLTFPKKKK